MIVGRVFPSARTTASAIESTAKGATGPEEAVETTKGAVDDTGNSSEGSPADKLLLVERGGLGIMYNQNKNQRRARERRTNATRQRARKTMVDDWQNSAWLLWLWNVYLNWEPLHWARHKTTLSEKRAPISPGSYE